MKLTKIHEEKEILTEGLKFGAKEQAMVRREARNILVGVEYEYHVNDEFRGEENSDEPNEGYDEAVWDKAYELMNDAAQKWREEWESEYADNEISEKNIGALTTHIMDTVNLAKNIHGLLVEAENIEDSVEIDMNDWDEEDYSDEENYFKGFDDEDSYEKVLDYLNLMKGIKTDIDTMVREVEEAIQYEPEDYSLFEDVDWSDLQTDLEEVSQFIDELPSVESFKKDADGIAMFLDAGITSVQSLVYNMGHVTEITGNDRDWDAEIGRGFEAQSGEAYEDFGKESNPYDGDDADVGDFLDEASNEVDRDDYTDSDSGDTVSNIEGMLNVSDNEWKVDPMSIEKVTTDASVDNGVEVITVPEPLNEALDTMAAMFDHIIDVGSTSSSTGMHVNMSMKGIRFDRRSFNQTKLVMLMDEKYLLTQFKIRNSNVASMFNSIKASALWEVATAQNTGALVETVEAEFVQTTEKFQLINFSNTFGGRSDVETSDRRIEFRYFGGDDYEQDFDKMERNMLRSAYMMMAAFHPTFAHKEYLRKLVQHLDRTFKHHFQMSFTEFTKRIRKLSGSDVEHMTKMIRSDEETASIKRVVMLLKANLLTFPAFGSVPAWERDEEVARMLDIKQSPEEREERATNRATSVAGRRESRMTRLMNRYNQ